MTGDSGFGRRARRLGPFTATIHAPPEVVFDVIAAPYLGRTPRAMAHKLQVIERGADLVIAEHYTPVLRGLRTATTLESVRFDRPRFIHFRLLRGPVPLVVETFELGASGDGRTTNFLYTGELSTDLWFVGSWWGRIVARSWERAVSASMHSIQEEAERRVVSSARIT